MYFSPHTRLIFYLEHNLFRISEHNLLRALHLLKHSLLFYTFLVILSARILVLIVDADTNFCTAGTETNFCTVDIEKDLGAGLNSCTVGIIHGWKAVALQYSVACYESAS